MSYYKILVLTIATILACYSSTPVRAQRIAATERHAALICNDGNVYTWGYNMDALLGDGTTELRKSAVRVVGLSNVVSLSCSRSGTFAVTSKGDVYTWGSINRQQVGVPSFLFMEVSPVRIPHVSQIKRVAIGGDMIYYLGQNESVRASGSNFNGEYGNGTKQDDFDSGSAVVTISNTMKIFAAAVTGYAISTPGELTGWGVNWAFLVDTTERTQVLLPEAILPSKRFVDGCVTFASDSEFGNQGSVRFITDSGDVYVWGSNKHGQLGLPDRYIKVPMKIDLPLPCAALAGGTTHTIAILTDGTVWAWGENTYGQLGNQTETSSIKPVKAIGLSEVVEIAAAGRSSYAITRDGTLYGWGHNYYRQLNLDGVEFQNTPVALPLPCSLVSDVNAQQGQSTQFVSPNPAHDYVTITMPATYQGSSTTVSIFSVHGELVFMQRLEPASSTRINISALPAGTYHANVTGNGVTLHSMIVKLP